MPLGHISSWSQWVNAHRDKIKRKFVQQEIQRLTEYVLVPGIVTNKNLVTTETTDHSATHDFRVNGRLVTATAGGDDWDAEDTVSFDNNSVAATCKLALQSSSGIGMNELEMTGGNEEIIFDLFNQRKEEAELELIEKKELGFAGIPTAGAANEAIRGIPYHITWASGAAQSFGGKNPYGHSSWQGIDLTAANMDGLWNWTDTYSEYTPDDLFTKLDIAMDETNFKAPRVMTQSMDYSELAQRIVLTTKLNMTKCKQAARLQNENLGLELTFPASGDGLLIRGRPLVAVPAFTPNNRTTMAAGLPQNPFYIVDMTAIKILVHTKFWFRPKISPVSKKHLQEALYVDSLCQTQCWRKRTQAVLATGAPS